MANACNLTGIWHGHADGAHISSVSISLVQTGANLIATVIPPAKGFKNEHGTHLDHVVSFPGINKGEKGYITANSHVNSSDPCSAIVWGTLTLPASEEKFWCKEPAFEPLPPSPPSPPLPAPPTPAPTPAPPPHNKKPNVVFVITDDQDVELGSLDAMPIVQKELIQSGTFFRNFFVDVPVCCPSRTSFLSGRYAHNNGAFGDPKSNWCGSGVFWKGPKQQHSIATYMKAAGYVTGIFGKELNSVDAQYVSPGWDRYFVLMDECKYFGNSWADNGKKTTMNSSVYMTTAIQEAAFEFLDANKRTPQQPWPFFMYVAPHAPHQPAQPDIMHERDFSDLVAPRTPAWNLSAPDHHWLVSMQPPLSPKDARESDEMFRRRWRTLRSVDKMVGALIDKLRDMGELNRTYILYSSDHGYHLGQWRIPAHKELAYETDLRVPFIVRGPGVRRDTTVEDIGLNVDVAVTIADLVGYAIPAAAQVDGRTLKPAMMESSIPATAAATTRTRRREEFLFEHSGGDISPAKVPNGTCGEAWMQPGGQPIQSVALCKCGNPMHHWISSANNSYTGLRILNATHNYKYVSYMDQVDFEEMFDISADPHELRNIIETAPHGVLAYMKQRLSQIQNCGVGINQTECP